MIHHPEWDIVIYEKSSYHEPCTSCFISQGSFFAKIIGKFVWTWAAGFKILLTFTFFVKFNQIQLGVYFNSAPFTASLVCSCPVKSFFTFFVKQPFTSEFLLIALKICHLAFADVMLNLNFCRTCAQYRFTAKSLSHWHLKLRCGRVAWFKCVLLNNALRMERNVHAWNIFSTQEFQRKNFFLLKIAKLCQNYSRFWIMQKFMLKNNFSWKFC